MRFLLLALLVALAGCDVDDDPLASHPLFYEVTTLRTLSEGTGVDLMDLNENGQALWHEGDQAILWDRGTVLEIPVGKFLGSSGEVLGDSSVWIQGQLTELPGRTRGITEDGTIYLLRNDTMFTWKAGTLTATDRPLGRLVGPEGRIWLVRDGTDCGFFLEGEWHGRASGRVCDIGTVEENGWAVVWTDAASGSARVVGPKGYSTPSAANHVNSRGDAVLSGTLMTPGGDSTNLSHSFSGIRLGAINDDGEILAQFDDRVVLLTPR